MPKTKTPSFILELPLVVQPPAERVLLGRFEAGRRLYNAVLDEALKRLALMRESKAWQAARRRPQGKARGEAFGACKARFGFSEYALHAVATRHKNAAGFRDRLGAHETQKIGTRVWKAVSAYAFGVRGRPHFKGRDRPLHSLEGKNNLAGIRWNRDTGCVTWGKLTLPAMLPSKGQDPWLHAGLDAQTQYCRIVWRLVNARRRWFVQIVQRGVAPAKYDFLACGHVVGLDVGPSTVAIVGETGVAIESFAPGVVQSWRHQRRLQRALDRSRRATNPGNYHRNGVARKGCRSWVKSKRYLKLQRQTAEVERRLAATRKKEHGELANRILGLGVQVQTETLSYKAFQRNFGRSVKVRAPGMFIDLLSRKAEHAGGKLVALNTRRLAMSQYDHISDSRTKKPLSQRWHRLGGSDVIVQRDCYSAFLAKHATEDGHSPSRLKEGWAVAEPLLERAGLCRLHPSTSRLPKGNPTVAIPSESIARERRLVQGLSRDVVRRKTESPEPPVHACLQNPLPLGRGRFSRQYQLAYLGHLTSPARDAMVLAQPSDRNGERTACKPAAGSR